MAKTPFMRHNFYGMLLIVATLCMGTASCVSNKSMTYLQGADRLYAAPQDIPQDYNLRIQPDDQLAISVSSKDAALIVPFNTQTLIGGGAASGNYASTVNTQSGVSYFYVDENGYIDFPIFGKILVKGLTVNEVSETIRQLMADGYIADAIVTTKIMSFKVTVLGDVKNPGVQSFTGQRLTLLEALGRAGDLNSSAIRTSVLVIREEAGERVSYVVDLTNPESVFQSPAYYMQQNDLVYVESNKSVKVKGSTSYTYLSVSSSLIGMLTSIVSLIVAISR